MDRCFAHRRQIDLIVARNAVSVLVVLPLLDTVELSRIFLRVLLLPGWSWHVDLKHAKV